LIRCVSAQAELFETAPISQYCEQPGGPGQSLIRTRHARQASMRASDIAYNASLLPFRPCTRIHAVQICRTNRRPSFLMILCGPSGLCGGRSAPGHVRPRGSDPAGSRHHCRAHRQSGTIRHCVSRVDDRTVASRRDDSHPRRLASVASKSTSRRVASRETR
jgi:hypothetical protein